MVAGAPLLEKTHSGSGYGGAFCINASSFDYKMILPVMIGSNIINLLKDRQPWQDLRKHC